MPMATPAEASRAANDVVFTPKAPMTLTTSRSISRMLTRLFRKVWMVGSTLRRSSIRANRRLSRVTIKRPTTKMTTAMRMCLPAVMERSMSLSISFSIFKASTDRASLAVFAAFKRNNIALNLRILLPRPADMPHTQREARRQSLGGKGSSFCRHHHAAPHVFPPRAYTGAGSAAATVLLPQPGRPCSPYCNK